MFPSDQDQNVASAFLLTNECNACTVVAAIMNSTRGRLGDTTHYITGRHDTLHYVLSQLICADCSPSLLELSRESNSPILSSRNPVICQHCIYHLDWFPPLFLPLHITNKHIWLVDLLNTLAGTFIFTKCNCVPWCAVRCLMLPGCFVEPFSAEPML